MEFGILDLASRRSAAPRMEFGFWNLKFGFWNLEFGIWILDFGFWNLEFGI